MLRCLYGSSGAEGFASTRLTSSLSNPPVNAPTLLFLHRRIIRCNWAFQLAFPQCTKIAPTLLHRFIRCQPDTLVPWRRIIRCLLKMQNSSIYFFVFCFAWPFYFIPGIYNCLFDKLISLIDCVVIQSPKSQNNGLMGPFSLQSWPSHQSGVVSTYSFTTAPVRFTE